MNLILNFFNKHKRWYFLLLLGGIGLHRLNSYFEVHPVSSYFVAVFLMTVFALMREFDNQIQTSPRTESNPSTINVKKLVWLFIKVLKIALIVFVSVYVVWEIYNVILWIRNK